jgi:HEPN domain-containing protein
MKNPNEGQRWLGEAQNELETANWDVKGNRASAACFWSQQAAEKALKAFLYFKGERIVLEHSVARLVQMCEAKETGFLQFLETAKMLDRYYVPTRYPNSLPGSAIPAESYSAEEAKRALHMGEEIVDFVAKRMTLPKKRSKG